MGIKSLQYDAQLNDDALLWRYTKLSTFLMLLDGKAFLPSVATLRSGDPLEGDLVPEPDWLIARLYEICGGDISRLDQWLIKNSDPVTRSFVENNPQEGSIRSDALARAYITELAKRRAVWCWYQADWESAAMWSIYGAAGVAVKTSVGDLKAAWSRDMECLVTRIFGGLGHRVGCCCWALWSAFGIW